MGFSAEEYGRRYLMERVGAAVLWECFSARLLELGHVQVSRSIVGSA